MNELRVLNTNGEVEITSVDLVKLINQFRKEEGNETEKKHNHLMRDIRNEIESLENVGIFNQSNFGLVTYKDGKGEERPCYSMNKAGVLQMLNKESAVVRYKTVQYIEKLEKENKSLKQDSYMINDPIERAKAWIEEEKERIALRELAEKQEREIEYKEDVIVGLTKDIDLADKRQRIGQIVKHNANSNYNARWGLLYEEFDKKYHIDTKRRLENAKIKGSVKKTTNRISYICDTMGMTNELYDVACKVFEGDYIDLLDEWRNSLDK